MQHIKNQPGLFSFLILGLLLIGQLQSSFAQQLSGKFNDFKSQNLILEGFDGFTTYVIDSTKSSATGEFKLEYTALDYGMGVLKTEAFKPVFIVLENEQVVLQGESPAATETLQFIKGIQNQAFKAYASQQPRREQALNAWLYLQKIYQQDTLFSIQDTPTMAIMAEVQRLGREEISFLASLPEDSFVSWFLPVRKLVSSVSVVAQYRPEDIPATREAFRKIDYADKRLYKSGLFKEAIENHVWFIENSSGALDQVFADLNTSIDIILDQLINDEARYNEVTEYLFKLLEKRSLFTSAEYLALKVLEEQSCTLEEDVSKQLEVYRQMKTGNVAPDIRFGEASYVPEHIKAKSLYEMDSDYTLVVFAAGWCSHCQREVPKLAELYKDWKAKGVEILLVSLDENQKDFVSFAAPFPFISTTEYQKWEGQAVRDYQVYATPTMLLLDKDKKILLRPNSAEHMKAWMEYELK